MTDAEPLDLEAIEVRANAGSVLGALTRSITVTREDAVFIAHAREDVPALIAEVRRLREQNVSTVAEIEELPMGSVVVDVQGDPWQRLGHGWQIAGDSKTAPAEFLSKLAPLRVVARPEEGDA